MLSKLPIEEVEDIAAGRPERPERRLATFARCCFGEVAGFRLSPKSTLARGVSDSGSAVKLAFPRND